MIKIEKNIPMPMIGSRGRQRIYPFNLMKKVGDSFFVAEKTPAQLSSVAYNWCKKYKPDWKFIAKKENDGARIWRCL
jgi:hypothetical protein